MRAIAIPLVALALAACADLPAPTPPPAVSPAPPAAPTPETVPAPVPVPETVPALPDEARMVSDLLAYYQRASTAGAEEQKREYNGALQAFNRDRTVAARVKLALLLAMPGGAVQDDARAIALLEPVASGTTPLRQLAVLMQAQVTDRSRAQKRADQLKEQLEQLREVERTIIERGREPPPRKP